MTGSSEGDPGPYGAGGAPPPLRAWSPRAWVTWLLVLAAATALLYVLRPNLDKAHFALAYLLIVLGGSAAGGRTLGLLLAALAFLAFDLLFLPPYLTLAIENPFDWLVLIAFLITSIVAAHLLSRARERAELARQRAVEVERLATLGAETLNAARSEDALHAVAEVIRSALGIACCEILVRSDGLQRELLHSAARAGPCRDQAASGSQWGTAQWVLEHRAPAARHTDGTTWVGSSARPDAFPGYRADEEIRALLLPLTVRDQSVGVLTLAHDAPIVFDPPARRFLGALTYYAALGVERVRLGAEAERAEALRQANAVKTALLATVSHDLRTPLTTIKALAHRLSAHGESDANTIEVEADRLEHFVAALLDFSRISGGALRLDVQLQAAEELVSAVMARVAGLPGASHIRLVVPPPRDGRQITLFGRFDLVHALHALANLVENALRYASAEAPVELRVARDGERLNFTVADRGPGVPAGEEALVFEPFYRARETPPGQGAGLGLAIARGLAEAQGGTVRYAPRPGGGSEFTLELAAEDSPALECEGDAERRAPPGGREPG